jgi:hypothetical protein
VVAKAFMEFQDRIWRGLHAEVTDDVLKLTGHPPRSFEDSVKDNIEEWNGAKTLPMHLINN